MCPRFAFNPNLQFCIIISFESGLMPELPGIPTKSNRSFFCAQRRRNALAVVDLPVMVRSMPRSHGDPAAAAHPALSAHHNHNYNYNYNYAAPPPPTTTAATDRGRGSREAAVGDGVRAWHGRCRPHALTQVVTSGFLSGWVTRRIQSRNAAEAGQRWRMTCSGSWLKPIAATGWSSPLH
eukprot:COSAG02_NODE_3041_length_7489_cov_7.290798_4_plen_180_part_00